MLAIRMQRTGRKGLPNYRIVVQDSRRTPLSGRVVAQLGSYNPHTKQLVLDKDKAQTYLNNGAQLSDRVVTLLKQESVTLPKWVADRTAKTRDIRHPEKLRKNQSVEEPAAPSSDEAVVADAAGTATAEEVAA